jgi:hypothetical protein
MCEFAEEEAMMREVEKASGGNRLANGEREGRTRKRGMGTHQCPPFQLVAGDMV